jgi:hypothetical protein
MVMVLSLISLAFVTTGFAETKTAPAKAPAAAAPEKAPAPEKAVAPEKTTMEKPAPAEKPAKPKVSGFVGTVTKVDASALTVKSNKAEVVFDASKPTFKGYKAITDVKVGDKVAAKYTKDGISIRKLAGAPVKAQKVKAKKTEKVAEKVEKKASEKVAEKVEKVAPKKTEKPADK